MGAGNDVRCNESVTDPFTGISSGTHSGIHSTGFTPNHHRHVTATDIFTTNQSDFRRLGHGIRRFDGGDHATGFNHAEGDSLHRSGAGGTGRGWLTDSSTAT